MAKTEETVEEEDTSLPGLSGRSALTVHEGQVSYLESEYDVDMSTMSPAEVISMAYATRNAWRKTEAYQGVKASQAEAREAEKAERAEAREAAAAERAEAKAAKEAAKAEKAESTKGAKKATKAPAKKAAGRKRASKAEATEEDPFE